MEELDEEDIEHIRSDYRKLAAKARRAIEKGLKDTACEEVAEGDDEEPDAFDKKGTRKK